MSDEVIQVFSPQTTITIEGENESITVNEGLKQDKVIICNVGAQGPQGPSGNTSNVTNNYIAGEPISGYKAVKIETDGLLYNADKDDSGDIWKIIGISISSGPIGASIQVLEKGFKKNSSLNGFSSGTVFVGNSGDLVQTPPSAGFCKKLGFIPQSGEIYVELAQAVVIN